jgi:hypothetical protein
MASTIHKAYTQSATNALTTELDALANNTNSSASSAIDNSSNLDLFMDLELNLGTTSSRSAGGVVAIYMTTRLDGSNFPDANETTATLVAVFPLDAATTARRCVRRDIPIPPEQFKLFARNSNLGVALAANSNTLKYRTHSITTA